MALVMRIPEEKAEFSLLFSRLVREELEREKREPN
jgi:hypothetical protein